MHHSLNKANLSDLVVVTGLVILFKADQNYRHFGPCDLEISRITLKTNREHLQSHPLIQIIVVIWKRSNRSQIVDFPTRVTLKVGK